MSAKLGYCFMVPACLVVLQAASSWTFSERFTRQSTTTTCTSAGSTCVNCKTLRNCVQAATGFVEVNTTCSGNTVCEAIGTTGFYGCVAKTDDSKCKCEEDKLSACDPQDASAQIFCDSEGEVIAAAPCPSGQTCSAGQCVSGSASTACTKSGWNAVLPECKTYQLCVSDGGTGFKPNSPPITGECEDSKKTVFDDVKGECVEVLEEIPDCEKIGVFPDEFDCARYVICAEEGSGKTGTYECCPTGSYFDEKIKGCSQTMLKENCTTKDPCLINIPDLKTCDPTAGGGSGGTGTVGGTCTAAQENQNTAYSANCQQYLKCKKQSNNTYTYILYKCPGVTVFNPSTKQCDLQSNVPSCTIPSG